MKELHRSKIEELCLKISTLCHNNGSEDWSGIFRRFASRLSSGDPDEIKRDILGVYKGTASFSDLILQDKNGPLIEANNELCKLRDLLYQTIIDTF